MENGLGLLQRGARTRLPAGALRVWRRMEVAVLAGHVYYFEKRMQRRAKLHGGGGGLGLGKHSDVNCLSEGYHHAMHFTFDGSMGGTFHCTKRSVDGSNGYAS